MSATKMRLTVAHNNEFELTPNLATLESVDSVYGKMAGDIVGGGRNTYLLADVNLQQVQALIDQAHAHGIKYNYLLNSPCLSNMETTRKYNDQMFAFIGTLVDMGVDGFVVAMPYLLDLIKKHFPKVAVSVSTFAIINSITKARIWEDKGADRLIIQQDQNRELKLIEKIRKAISCEIELFANNLCLDQCPYPPFHANFNAHGSMSNDKTKGFALDYCGYSCTERRLTNPVEFIRGRFIRPEDIHIYEEIGVDVFKLADRQKSTAWLTRVATAYHNRYFDGNMATLIGYPFLRGEDDAINVNNPTRWMLRPDFIHMDVLKELRYLGEGKDLVYVDNRKLDGFIEYFKKHDCRMSICDVECTHCQKYADKAITIDEAAVAERLTHHKKIHEMMVDRSAFATEPLPKQVIIKAMRKLKVGPAGRRPNPDGRPAPKGA